MQTSKGDNRSSYGTKVRDSVFKPGFEVLSSMEIERVLSRIGVSAISNKVVGKRSGSHLSGRKGSKFDQCVEDYHWFEQLARSYWGIRCTLHDFITVNDDERVKVKQSMLETLEALAVQFAAGTGESFLKTHMNLLVSRSVLDQEDCPRPASPLFFTTIKRKIQLRLVRARQGSKTCRGFFYTLQMTKKVWLEMPKSALDKALLKHRTVLSSTKDLSKEACEWILKAVDLVVPPGTKYVPGTCCPTWSACYDNNRAKGGNRFLSVGGELPMSEEDLQRASLLMGAVDGSGVEITPPAFPRMLSPSYGAVQSRRQERECWDRACRQFGFEKENPLSSTIDYIFDDSRADFGRYNVQVVSLPEPGKFRILSKGPSAVYTGVRGLQGFLLDAWKRTPYSTMVDDLDEEISSVYRRGGLFFFDRVVSGDFSASTDELALEASVACIDRVLQNLDLYGTETGHLALMNFLKINVEYKDGHVRMTNGQLMGASLSFPILCMINLSTVLRLRSPEILTMTKINGDDVSFPATGLFVEKWNENIKEVGWTKSPGKNYVTKFGTDGKVCMQINSCLYMIRNPVRTIQEMTFFASKNRFPRNLTDEGPILERVGYLNYSLAMGHRVKSDPTITLRTVPAIWEKMHKQNEYARCDTLRYLFLTRNADLLRGKLVVGDSTFTPNWYFPTSLGGLGLPKPEGPVYATHIQRRLASFLAQNPLYGWLIETGVTDLPQGTMEGLRITKKILPQLLPRSRFIVGPLPYTQSMKYCEDTLGRVLGTRMWDDLTPKEAEPMRRFKLPRKQVQSSPMMKVRKILDYVLDVVPRYPGERMRVPDKRIVLDLSHVGPETHDFGVYYQDDLA